jgi:hypothetical protein
VNKVTTNVTYQIVGFSTNYRSSNSANSLSTSSLLSNAIGVGVGTGGSGKHHKSSGCSGIQTSNENTFYAGAIYAAQSALLAEQGLNAGTKNVIILLSDGNATAQQTNMANSSNSNSSTTWATNSGTYPSWGVHDRVWVANDLQLQQLRKRCWSRRTPRYQSVYRDEDDGIKLTEFLLRLLHDRRRPGMPGHWPARLFFVRHLQGDRVSIDDRQADSEWHGNDYALEQLELRLRESLWERR